jgi:hypothetical protein
MSEIVLFEHVNFRGAHKHLYGSEENLAHPEDNFFNDRISSFVIVSGTWQFFRDINFTGPASNIFGPGRFNWVEAVGIPNDSVSSVRRVS